MKENQIHISFNSKLLILLVQGIYNWNMLLAFLHIFLRFIYLCLILTLCLMLRISNFLPLEKYIFHIIFCFCFYMPFSLPLNFQSTKTSFMIQAFSVWWFLFFTEICLLNFYLSFDVLPAKVFEQNFLYLENNLRFTKLLRSFHAHLC